jgi:hypothetical protein
MLTACSELMPRCIWTVFEKRGSRNVPTLAVLMVSFAFSSHFFKPLDPVGDETHVKRIKKIHDPIQLHVMWECSWNPGVVVPKFNYGLLSETDYAACNIVMFCAAVVHAVGIDLKTSGCQPFRKWGHFCCFTKFPQSAVRLGSLKRENA